MKITKLVPKIIYGDGTFKNLKESLNELFQLSNGYLVYIIDSVHQKTGLRKRLKERDIDVVIDADISLHEPKTSYVDEIRDKILLEKKDELPVIIVGIGGGSVMDIAKAVSIILTNKGSSTDYQGWDLVKEKAIPKIGVPTLSGTGTEATRTTILTSAEKKLGINSDQSMFNAVLLDPSLLKTVNPQQEFYTAMDCFIHCVESLDGSFIDELGRVFASSAKKLAMDFFLKEKNYGKLMIASYLGGCAITNSETGVCHPLSHAMGLVLGCRHGLATCVVFNQLEEFYGNDVRIFKEMLDKNNIKLPEKITKNVTPEMMERMIEATLNAERPLTNALGKNWRDILTRDKIIKLYKKM